jgi:N-methylhydantoinase B
LSGGDFTSVDLTSASGLRSQGSCCLSPGGGGFGDPRTRDPALVLRDVRDGVVSAAAAERDYAVAIAKDGRCIDETRTAALRTAAQ